jgi:hypothetical protein
MVPRAVQDAGYTAVGLGVLALQQVQIRRRELRSKMCAGVRTARAVAWPVTKSLDALPRIPGPVGPVVEFGRRRLVAVLRPGG